MKENLSLYEFKLLPDGEQYNIIFNKGQFLEYHLERERRFALYAVEKFFVEVEYDSLTNTIMGKTSFVSGEKLNRYSNIEKLL